MSFGVSDGRGLRVQRRLAERPVRAVARHLVSPAFHRMIADLVRFNRDARRLLAIGRRPVAGRLAGRAAATRETFVERLIVPQASAVWSADPRQMWSFPARFLVEFFDNHGMLGLRGRPRWRTVAGGSRTYVEALTRPWRERLAALDTPVDGDRARRGRRDGRHARGWRRSASTTVVLATHSDQALALLRDPSDRERRAARRDPLPAQRGGAAHRRALLPRRRRAWASWNYHLPPGRRPARRRSPTT